jgi:hypothetical protein
VPKCSKLAPNLVTFFPILFVIGLGQSLQELCDFFHIREFLHGVYSSTWERFGLPQGYFRKHVGSLVRPQCVLASLGLLGASECRCAVFSVFEMFKDVLSLCGVLASSRPPGLGNKEVILSAS